MELDQDHLNEIGTLLHIAETIITNHPKYSGIARACQKRLDEINQACIDGESVPKPTPPAELKAAQHTTGKLSLKDQNRPEPNSSGAQDGDNLLKSDSASVERRI